MKIKTHFVPESNRPYLTANKEYAVRGLVLPHEAYIIDDIGHLLRVFIGKPCFQLNGHYWALAAERVTL